MKRKLKKIIMALLAVTLFTGIMLLSVDKNDSGEWEFATLKSMAQGSEDGDDGGGEEDGDESGAKSIIMTETGSDIICIGSRMHKVVNFTVACIGVGSLPCTAGDWTSFEETEIKCGAAR